MSPFAPIDPILEKGYNVRLLADDFEGLINAWTARSEKFRSTANSSLNCQYDEGEKNKLDLFRSGKPNAPLYVFVHGGYWQGGDKDFYSFIADPFVKSGIDVAIIGYQLCPESSMTGIVNQIRTALIWLWKNSRDYAISKDRINISGHSAGGHITGMVLATDWQQISSDLPKNLVKTGIPISGLYQLEPLRKTSIAEALGLDDAETMALSPHFLEPITTAPILVILGEAETPAFHWQTDQFIEKWKLNEALVEYHSEPGADHFEVIERLAREDTQIFDRIKRCIL